MPTIITLLTDFGTADGYVGEVKGVLATAAPDASIVDITHDIPAHDVDAGRHTVSRYWRRFPPGTVHLAVVDPDVGTDRSAIAVASDGQFLVAPDNGLLSHALLQPGAQVVRLAVSPGASPTFHARDVFAPAAARLACGATVASLGTIGHDPVVLLTPEPELDVTGAAVGQVIAIDRFGNAITNLMAQRATRVHVAGRTLKIVRTYGHLDPGEAGALIGSNGYVEVVVGQGSAARQLGLTKGAAVRLS
ncbi:MAG: SAM-dependent chlorinase/fluorinase [Gemmatimonadota bacterium]